MSSTIDDLFVTIVVLITITLSLVVVLNVTNGSYEKWWSFKSTL